MFLGIDPGKSGGVAWLHKDVARTAKMPATAADLCEWFDDLIAWYAPYAAWRCVLEKVASSPQMGVKSAFTFGCGYGQLIGVLTALGIPFDEVSPQRWQKALGCMTAGDKNVSKRRAQQLFPGLKVTHATADALLLAEFCRRVNG